MARLCCWHTGEGARYARPGNRERGQGNPSLVPFPLFPSKMATAFLSHSDCGRHDTGWGHPEHVGRLRAIPRALRNDFELFEQLEHREARHATPEELALAHDARYVSLIEQLAESGGARLDADTVVSE